MKSVVLLIALMETILIWPNRLPAQKGIPLYTAPLGVESYTFRKSFPLDVAKTLDTIQQMGFTEIEGSSNGVPPAEFRKLCDQRGISIPSIGASYEQITGATDSVIQAARVLGATYVMCAWIPHSGGVLSFENASRAVRDFNRVGKIMREYGITFCYHPHGYEFQPYQQGTLLDYLIENTQPEYVSFEMDIMWIHFGGGDPVALLQQYGSRWKLMHLKDLRKGAPKNLTGLTGPENDVPLGQGELDIPAILKQAARTGIRHYFLEDESNQVNRQVPQSILYLKSLLQ